MIGPPCRSEEVQNMHHSAVSDSRIENNMHCQMPFEVELLNLILVMDFYHMIP